MIKVTLGILALTSLPLSAQAVDLEAGRAAFETCRGCHSSPGYSNTYPTYYVPKIGGQVPSYTIAALNAYKKSTRGHRTMMANAFNLSDKRLEDLAAYLAKQTSSSKYSASNGGDSAKGQKLAETCKACHNDDKSPEAANPRLAGQHANYLERALLDYQTGKREHALMKSMVEGLSATDIKDISAYFSSLTGLTSTQ